MHGAALMASNEFFPQLRRQERTVTLTRTAAEHTQKQSTRGVVSPAAAASIEMMSGKRAGPTAIHGIHGAQSNEQLTMRRSP
jgi:hypothetical protein